MTPNNDVSMSITNFCVWAVDQTQSSCILITCSSTALYLQPCRNELLVLTISLLAILSPAGMKSIKGIESHGVLRLLKDGDSQLGNEAPENDTWMTPCAHIAIFFTGTHWRNFSRDSVSKTLSIFWKTYFYFKNAKQLGRDCLSLFPFTSKGAKQKTHLP
jgi:hypothetical protein